METKVEILNELKELSPLLAGMDKINVFTVPAGYFENLGNDILTGLTSEKGVIINGLPDSFSVDIPQGYFDTLAGDVLNKIKAQDASGELRTLSPLLYSIQHENVFEVPAGYFDSLADAVFAKVRSPQAKVVSMNRRSAGFMKYAVAAAFTGVMALGVFTFTDHKKNTIDAVVEQGKQIARENKFDEELSKVSDEEIVKYLEANGSDVKTALVATSVDENELPSQEDYLMDDKTLDKYLNSINVNDLKN
jgi:hypothetical protein